MSSTSTVRQFVTPQALIGLSFLGLNAGVSYSFFHMNSFKLFIGLLLAVAILVVFQLKHSKSLTEVRPTGLLVLLALPLLVSIPGAVLNRFGENYNFLYELGSSLILWIWAFYLFQLLRSTGSFVSWFGWLSVALFGASLWALSQGLGFFIDGNVISGQVKAGFGHRNYFASYLIINIPVFVMLVFAGGIKQWRQKRQLWFLGVCLFGVISLYLTHTRAAIVAFGLVFWLLLFGYGWFVLDRGLRKKWLSALIGLAFLGTTGVVSYGVSGSPDAVYGSRYEQLFSQRAWIGRLIPWDVALSATKDSPLVGQGLGSFYNQFFLYQDPETRLYHSERSYNHAHSEPLEILSESGVIGGLVWLVGLFWVGRAVTRVLRRGEDRFEQCLALGLGGGILAFWIHGSFSVAPRMLVAELPFVLNLAALLALEAKGRKVVLLSPSARRGWSLFNVAVLVAAGLALLPWLQRQHQYSLSLQMPETMAKVNYLEGIAETSTDIYMLDGLLHSQAKFRRTTEMSKTIQKIEGLIPHFRDVDYQKAVLAVLLKKMDLARTYAQKAEEVDRYYLPNLRLLMNLALETDDYEGFKKQFRLMTRLLLFHKFVIVAFDENAASFKTEATSMGVEFAQEGNQIEVKFDPIWLREKYDQLRQVRSSSPTRYEQQQLMQRQASFIGRNPFFKMKVRPEFLADEAEVFQKLERFKQTSRELSKQESYLKFLMAKELKKSPAGARLQIQVSYQQRYDKIKQREQTKLDLLETQLDEKAQFHQFINNHKFAAAWLSEWQLLFFPNEQK